MHLVSKNKTKSANTYKNRLIWHNIREYILPFDYTFIYLWQNIACYEQNNWKKKRTGGTRKVVS